MTDNAGEIVLVSGATGFIAAQLVRELLSKGYRVRGTVRDMARGDAMFRESASLDGRERLELVRADLLERGSFAGVMAGVSCVMHTASPYVLSVEDPQRDLVDPALEGTREVLAAAAATPSVKRVVLTSSIGAMADHPPKKPLSEVDWNTRSTLKRNPYYYSKALAERAAWAFMEAEKPRFSLVAVNPAAVIGPSLSPALNTSNQILRDVLGGAEGSPPGLRSVGRYPGIIDLAWGFVDVRDVALAHLLAMVTPKARGRYLCVAQALHMRELVALLKRHGLGERYPLPKRNLAHGLGNFLVRCGSFFQPKGIDTFLRSHLGRQPLFDNRKIKRELGMTFRNVEKSLLDTVQDLERWGHVAPKGTTGRSSEVTA